MGLTRDALQGFIDGYLKAGGDAENIKIDIIDWTEKHPIYPLTKEAQEIVKADLESYRGIPKKVISAPAPLDLAPKEIVP